jgi:hypothetical protein
MIPLQSFWPRWSYALPIGIHNHYRRGCVYKHIYSILYWILGKHIVHQPPPRHVDIMAGISACTAQIPIASIPTHNGPDSSALSLGALLLSIRQSTPRRISKYYFLIKLWVAPRRYTHTPEDGKQQSNLTQSITKNRPFCNPSRGRSIRQGGRLGGNYKEIKTCH